MRVAHPLDEMKPAPGDLQRGCGGGGAQGVRWWGQSGSVTATGLPLADDAPRSMLALHLSALRARL